MVTLPFSVLNRVIEQTPPTHPPHFSQKDFQKFLNIMNQSPQDTKYNSTNSAQNPQLTTR